MAADHRQQLLRRLRTIEGHVRGIERMVEAGAQGAELLNQSRAVQQALIRLDQLILAEQLRETLATAAEASDEHERRRLIEQLAALYSALAR